MTTYTEDEIALARRGAKWLEWIETHIGVWVDRHSQNTMCMGWTDTMPDNPTFFVALLDKCDADGIHYAVQPEWTTIEVKYAGYGAHTNRALALLLALDSAGRLPEDDA